MISRADIANLTIEQLTSTAWLKKGVYVSW
jgi:hypothetical protein